MDISRVTVDGRRFMIDCRQFTEGQLRLARLSARLLVASEDKLQFVPNIQNPQTIIGQLATNAEIATLYDLPYTSLQAWEQSSPDVVE